MNNPADTAQKNAKKERSWRFYLAGAIALLALIVVFQNTGDTEVKFLFAETTLPLFFALIITLLVGVAIGWLLPKVRTATRHERRHDPDRD